MSEISPLVSVLMTAYNREKFIADAIKSVLDSTYPHFELIVVDDGSVDNTVSIVRSFLEKDSRIRLFINEKNLGDYPNRNKAAGWAKGEYLKYVDSDDFIYPHGLELLVENMQAFPDAGWGLCSLAQDFDRPFPFCLTPKQAYEYNYLGPGLFHKAPLSSIIRKNVFDEAGGFSNDRMVGDNEMWHRLALKYNVVLMQDGIVWSRGHEGQEMASFHQYASDYEKIMVRYLKSSACPMDKNTISEILSRRKRNNQIGLARAAVKLDGRMIKMQWGKLKAYR